MKFEGSALLRHAAIALFAALALALPQTASAQNAALQGTWNFIPEKSNTTPGPVRYKSGKLTITDGGQVMDLEAVDASGKPIKANISAVADGKPHPVTGITNYDSGMWTKNNDNNTSFRFLKGKGIAALGTRVLSPDGSTITINETQYDDKGKIRSTATLVFVNPEVKVATVTPPAQQAAAPPPPPRQALTPEETAASEVLAKGNDDEAIKLFTAIISGKPTEMLYYDHVSRGIAYARKGQNEQALADFSEALKLMAHNFLGQATEGAADNDKACELDKGFCMN